MRVLLVENCDDDAILIHELLTKAPGGPYDIDWVERLSAAQDHFRAAACDVVLLSLCLPDSQGLATVERMLQAAPEAPIVVITTLEDETVALSAVQRGAQDYLVKDQLTPSFLGRVLRYAIERKEAERALRESEERFRTITENASDIVAVLSPEGNCLFISASVENLLGCSAHAVQGTNVLQWVHPHDQDRTRSALQAVANLSRSAQPVTLRVRGASGSWHWIEAKARNLLQHPAVRGIVANARDITEHHLAQEAINAQLSRLDLLNELTRAIADRQDLARMLPILLAHLEDSMALDGSAIYIYDGQADSLSLAASSGLLEGDPHQGDHGPPSRLSTEGLRSCLTRQSTYVRDYAESPETIPLLANAGLRSGVALPLHAGGMLYGLLVTARCQAHGFTSDEIEFLRRLGEHIALAIRQDTLLWDLHSAYKELQRTQQSALEQERLRILGQMASGIAHDINNALMPITTYAELLAMRVPDLDEHAQRYLKSILMAADDIKKTVGRMRELYRKRDGRDQVRSIHIARLMRDVVDLTRPRWHDLPQQQGVTIAVKIETDGAPTYVTAVESELREALANLIGNAVDAMPIGGSITLRARPWSRSLLAIEVCDTGYGMDAETLRQCLEPFFTAKGQSGTGLGLSMVQGIVQGHGGRVEIESQPGEGTTVRLLLPMDGPAAARRELPSSGCCQSRPLRVLCVDDDDRVRAALMDMLEADGHIVVGAPGGEAGIQQFRHALLHGMPFDIVLTDLGMPHIDGRMVALAIKAESPETPVVLLTGWGTFMEPGVFPEGIDAILGKPPELASIRKVFAKLTQR